jgi:hypothetical protein
MLGGNFPNVSAPKFTSRWTERERRGPVLLSGVVAPFLWFSVVSAAFQQTPGLRRGNAPLHSSLAAGSDFEHSRQVSAPCALFLP